MAVSGYLALKQNYAKLITDEQILQFLDKLEISRDSVEKITGGGCGGSKIVWFKSNLQNHNYGFAMTFMSLSVGISGDKQTKQANLILKAAWRNYLSELFPEYREDARAELEEEAKYFKEQSLKNLKKDIKVKDMSNWSERRLWYREMGKPYKMKDSPEVKTKKTEKSIKAYERDIEKELSMF